MEVSCVQSRLHHINKFSEIQIFHFMLELKVRWSHKICIWTFTKLRSLWIQSLNSSYELLTVYVSLTRCYFHTDFKNLYNSFLTHFNVLRSWEKKAAVHSIKCRNNATITLYQNQACGDVIVFIQKGYFIFTRKVLWNYQMKRDYFGSCCGLEKSTKHERDSC